jgi:hypothetical protein
MRFFLENFFIEIIAFYFTRYQNRKYKHQYLHQNKYHNLHLHMKHMFLHLGKRLRGNLIHILHHRFCILNHKLCKLHQLCQHPNYRLYKIQGKIHTYLQLLFRIYLRRRQHRKNKLFHHLEDCEKDYFPHKSHNLQVHLQNMSGMKYHSFGKLLCYPHNDHWDK